MQAQTTLNPALGAYYLHGVMETACGFKLNPDSTFEFFFSQGALDRFGQGKWTMHNSQLILNSGKKPTTDFSLTASKQVSGDSILIQLKEENTVLLSHVACKLYGGGRVQEAVADEQGLVSFQQQEVEVIELIFEFCPEKKSRFVVKEKQHNYFEFRFEPTLMEIFFNDFKLQASAGSFTGANPVLDGNDFEYSKQQ